MIAMFDSGLGGLSVWRAVNDLLPDWPISFVADQAYCPYGTRPLAEIQSRSLRIARWLHGQGAELIVVACNTATSAAIETLRAELPIPIVGVEPAIKPAAASSRTGCIAVLATPSTLNGERFHLLVQRYAGSTEVLTVPVEGWVERVEAGDLDSPQVRVLVESVVGPLVRRGIDRIVLGCTHYPFLAKLIGHVAGQHIELVDPAQAVARRIAELLRGHTPGHKLEHHFYTSLVDTSGMRHVLPQLIGIEAEVASVLDLTC